MELACPSCATRFTVPDGAIGPKGRKLKCSQCGHTWRQMPPEPEAARAPRDMRSEAPEPTRAKEEEETLPPAGPVPLEMEPRGNGPAPDRADGVHSTDDDPFESLGGRVDDGEDPLAGFDFDRSDEGEPFSDLGFGEGEEGEDGDGSNLDDLLSSEPEPIPAMFAGRESAPAKGRSSALVWLLVLLVVVGGMLGGAWFFRERLVDTVPQLERFYEMAGIAAAPLGHGLLFKDVTSDLVDRGNGQTLVVRGFITNESDRDRPVPYLRLDLFGADEALLDTVVAEPPKPVLAADETVGFRIQADNPSAATRRFTVNWAEAPGGGAPEATAASDPSAAE